MPWSVIQQNSSFRSCRLFCKNMPPIVRRKTILVSFLHSHDLMHINPISNEVDAPNPLRGMFKMLHWHPVSNEVWLLHWSCFAVYEQENETGYHLIIELSDSLGEIPSLPEILCVENLSWNSQTIIDFLQALMIIWITIAFLDRADAMIQEFEKIRVLISHDGKVHWEPGGVFMTTCDIDITYFPFDTQVSIVLKSTTRWHLYFIQVLHHATLSLQACPIEIGAWAYKSTRMNLTSVSDSIETHEFKVNGEWAIRGTKARWDEITLPCCPDIRYSKVVFTMFLDRRYMFYIMNIVLPCCLLSVLILVVFCVPPDAGEKISAGISVLLAFTVFLLMLADNVPRTSLDVPIIGMSLWCDASQMQNFFVIDSFVLLLKLIDVGRNNPETSQFIINYLFNRGSPSCRLFLDNKAVQVWL